MSSWNDVAPGGIACRSLINVCLFLLVVGGQIARVWSAETAPTADEGKVLKPTLLRTELRVGRDLDLDDVKLVNVKSSAGDDVKILVGRNSRKGRSETGSFLMRQALASVPPTMGVRTARRALHFAHSPMMLQQNALMQKRKENNGQQTAVEKRPEGRQDEERPPVQNAIFNSDIRDGGRNARKLRLGTAVPDSAAYIWGTTFADEADTRHRVRPFQPVFIPVIRNSSAWSDDRRAPTDMVRALSSRELRGMQHFRPPMSLTADNTLRMARQASVPKSEESSRTARYYAAANNKRPNSLLTKGDFVMNNERRKQQPEIAVVDGPAVMVIEGVREPDAPEDKLNTWRNARVLENKLVPYPIGYTPPRVEMQSFDR